MCGTWTERVNSVWIANCVHACSGWNLSLPEDLAGEEGPCWFLTSKLYHCQPGLSVHLTVGFWLHAADWELDAQISTVLCRKTPQWKYAYSTSGWETLGKDRPRGCQGLRWRWQFPGGRRSATSQLSRRGGNGVTGHTVESQELWGETGKCHWEGPQVSLYQKTWRMSKMRFGFQEARSSLVGWRMTKDKKRLYFYLSNSDVKW